MRRITLLGNLVLDVLIDSRFSDLLPGRQTEVPVRLVAGGGYGNCARVLRDANVSFEGVACAGDDAAGRALTSLVKPRPVTRRGSTELSVIATVGERTIVNQQGSASLVLADVTTLMQDDGVLLMAYLNCCGMDEEAVGQLMEDARSRGIRVVAGLNGVWSERRREGVLKALPALTIISCNLDEARWLTGGNTVEECARFLGQRTPAAIVTQGADGFLLQKGASVEHVSSPNVASRRTLGAGDAFLSGLAMGIAQGLTDRDACRLAMDIAVDFVSHG